MERDVDVLGRAKYLHLHMQENDQNSVQPLEAFIDLSWQSELSGISKCDNNGHSALRGMQLDSECNELICK